MATYFHLETGFICLVEQDIFLALMMPGRKLASAKFDNLRGKKILGGVDAETEDLAYKFTLEEGMERKPGTWRIAIQISADEIVFTAPVVNVQEGAIPEALRETAERYKTGS
jgi:hypothetical protein